MPELPEVETVCCGLNKLVLNVPILDVTIKCDRLRYPVPLCLKVSLCGNEFKRISRRGKYILLFTASGTVLIHLGMSGRLLVLPRQEPSYKHEHVVVVFANGLSLRLIDPRRFGAILWIGDAPHLHPLLYKLGVEPLSKSFTAAYMYKVAQGRKTSIKQLLMNAEIVVGIGNIYANEALFLSGIRPQRKAATLGQENYQKLVAAIKYILRQAIKCGGTTIRDFVSSGGELGYFVQRLKVYGRAHQPCLKCGSKLKTIRLGQRSTVYCPYCQK